MRRTVSAGLAAVILTVSLAAPVAAKPEASGPACADIRVQATYIDETVDPTLLGPSAKVAITTAAPSCPRIRYAAYVQWSNGSSGAEVAGNGTTRLEMTIYLGTTDEWVCLRAESRGGRLFDSAPNAGCLSLRLNDTEIRPPVD